MKDTIDIALVLCYNLALLAGTIFLVDICDWSPWWFMLTVALMLNFKRTKE